MTDQTQVERTVRVPAPPARVWEVVTGPAWLGEDVQLELVPGGDAVFGSRTGWVEEAVAPGSEGPGGRLVFWWSSRGEPASRVEVRLEPDSEHATRLYVVEARPLELLDLVGIPAPGAGSTPRGPAMLSLA